MPNVYGKDMDKYTDMILDLTERYTTLFKVGNRIDVDELFSVTAILEKKDSYSTNEWQEIYAKYIKSNPFVLLALVAEQNFPLDLALNLKNHMSLHMNEYWDELLKRPDLSQKIINEICEHQFPETNEFCRKYMFFSDMDKEKDVCVRGQESVNKIALYVAQNSEKINRTYPYCFLSQTLTRCNDVTNLDEVMNTKEIAEEHVKYLLDNENIAEAIRDKLLDNCSCDIFLLTNPTAYAVSRMYESAVAGMDLSENDKMSMQCRDKSVSLVLRLAQKGMLSYSCEIDLANRLKATFKGVKKEMQD